MKIFITGGTTGIGLELCRQYLKDGHQVAVNGRDLAKIPPTLREEFPATFFPYEFDVSDREAFDQALHNFLQGEPLDIMIANAGRSVGKKSMVPNFEMARELIRINIIGVLNAFELALKSMVPQKKGQLVIIGSVAGMVGLPGAGSYSGSKAYVMAFAESLGLDLRSLNIDVTIIAPGFIDTPLTQLNDHKMPFLLPVTEGARRIKKAIQQKKVLYIFPLPMKIVILILRWMPRPCYRWLMTLKMFNYAHGHNKS